MPRLWQLTQAIAPLFDSRGSKNNIFPSAIFSGLLRLSCISGAAVGMGEKKTRALVMRSFAAAAELTANNNVIAATHFAR